MRAKLIVDDVEPYDGGENLSFRAVGKSEPYDENGSDENNTYASFTPMANLKMTVNNPNLLGKFKVGQEFYVDFTPAN
jgi:hypothetical protein